MYSRYNINGRKSPAYAILTNIALLSNRSRRILGRFGFFLLSEFSRLSSLSEEELKLFSKSFLILHGLLLSFYVIYKVLDVFICNTYSQYTYISQKLLLITITSQDRINQCGRCAAAHKAPQSVNHMDVSQYPYI